MSNKTIQAPIRLATKYDFQYFIAEGKTKLKRGKDYYRKTIDNEIILKWVPEFFEDKKAVTAYWLELVKEIEAQKIYVLAHQ